MAMKEGYTHKLGSTTSKSNGAGLGLVSPSLTGDLFDRVVAILEQARSNVVRAVNSNMVISYWLVGREIVREVQEGAERAEYGKRVLEELSVRLTKRYQKGFSVPNLQNFRKFYLVYPDRIAIQYPLGTEFVEENCSSAKNQYPEGRESISATGSLQVEQESVQGFFSQLSWSHYRALMRVTDGDARWFYEREAVVCGWDMLMIATMEPFHDRTMEPLEDRGYGATP